MAPAGSIGRRSPRAFLVAALAAVAACGSDGAPVTEPPPPTPLPRFAALLDSARRVHDLPALGAAIVTSDGVVYLATVGTRRHGGTTSVTTNDKWHLGSVLKHQTAVLVARLVAEGKLSWSTTLAEHFPELVETANAAYRPATLRDLLSHTTGLPRDYSSGVALPRDARLAATQWALRQPPQAASGVYLYSNVGFMVAGAIVERTMGVPFERAIDSLVWRPLGITTGGFGPPGTPGVEDEPLGHTRSANGALTIYRPEHPNAENPVEYGPAGRAHMSLPDWARFVSALLAAEQGGDTPVLRSGDWKALLAAPYVATSATGGYGYGMVIADRPWALGRALFHDGTNLRHYALVGIAPGRDFAVLIASNQYSETMGAIVDGIFGRLVNFHLLGS